MSVDFGFRQNQVPTASAGSKSGTEDDSSISDTLSATDGDGDSLTYSLVSGSVKVDGVAKSDSLVTVNSDGTWSYAPTGDQDLNTGQTRTITFDFVANDGAVDSNAATVTITVNGLNEQFTIVGTPNPDTIVGTDQQPTVHLTEFTIYGRAEDDTLTGGTANDKLLGEGDDDTLYGLDGDDVLNGGDGNDVLDGGTGSDTMKGRDGNDAYVVDSSGDVVVEAASGGTDEVRSAIAFNLGGYYLENLLLTGSAAIDGTGNGGANVITGNSGANMLRGEDGDDTLSGAAGADVLNGGNGMDRLDGGADADLLKGGAGDDTYVVADAGDQILETASGGSDTIESSINWSLGGQYVEKLVLTGAALNGVGNTLANTITGNAGANALTGQDGDDTLNGMGGTDTLSGGEGKDWLDGGTGADTMKGYLGDDTYVIDDAGDTIVESSAAGGTDTAMSSVSYSLAGVYVERLVLTGSGAVDGTGNTLDNALTGNAGANSLGGMAGADALHGMGGNDTLDGGSGADGFYFETALDAANNVDTISGYNVADDTIFLDSNVFAGIGADGTLDAAAFALGTVAGDATDRIVYDAGSGNLFFDADGDGGVSAAVLFAHVAPGTMLTAADFTVFTGV
jgi:VCBS repeat-containing protein